MKPSIMFRLVRSSESLTFNIDDGRIILRGNFMTWISLDYVEEIEKSPANLVNVSVHVITNKTYLPVSVFGIRRYIYVPGKSFGSYERTYIVAT